jgi:hypothetical protein
MISHQRSRRMPLAGKIEENRTLKRLQWTDGGIGICLRLYDIGMDIE